MVVFVSLPLGLAHGFSGFFELIVLNLGGQMRERAPKSSLETHLGLPVWGPLFRHQASWGPPPQPPHPVRALQASQADSSWARHWQYNRAVIIGPYSFLRDNPHLGWAFSVLSVIFSLMFTQGMYRFLLLLRLLLRLWGCIPSMCVLTCVWGFCSSSVAARAQELKWQRPRECLTHRQLSAFNGLD